jgi:NAD(P)-dependent dehydrogenase (short-subunit alcohol dehydrogenase family)
VVGAVEQTVRDLGRIDILVNNAGILLGGGDLGAITLEEVDRTLAVNVRAVFLASQAAARHMTQGGRIINIGTCVTERVPGPGMTLRPAGRRWRPLHHRHRHQHRRRIRRLSSSASLIQRRHPAQATTYLWRAVTLVYAGRKSAELGIRFPSKEVRP